MTLSLLANIADLLAALGVIGSLLFLAFELRRSNRDTRQANWRALLDSYRSFKALTNDLAYAEFILRARNDWPDLSPAEKLSFEHYQEQGIHVMGNFFKHASTMPEDLIGLTEAVEVCMVDHLTGAGARAWYADNRARGRLMPATYRNIDDILARADRKAERV
ncbi:hypothetical protein GQ651_04135 [Alphaproteobacteria bacterium GH1-50]|uniref:Uncharacterized protein n=1 Tax=Kangsaoukella pontilimi TaxID=2691042 RepID=A0A7C9MBS7_9RHOB|nr:hypothetical protein [Kangsaoukella pontilimi]MXQ07031.1 hypothetical protein [Kangsaoukella pontilimi]